MAAKKILNQDDFRAYILRKLGAPVIMINLDKEQVDDAINDALQKFWEYHRDGSQQSAYIYQVTQEDVDRGYIKVPENIDDVVTVIPGPPIESIGNWATPQWQMAQSMLVPKAALVSIRLVDYVSMQQRLSDIGSVLNNFKEFVYKKYQRRLYPRFRIEKDYMLAFECYENIDPTDEENQEAWNDMWLKAYATALVKRRWAEVLKKARGIKLPGGIELDGDTMYNEAIDEIKELEDNLQNGQQYPIEFMMG
ncbi:head-tail adaptor Ad2 [Serratia phage vB_SmaA_3M]|uniref:Neck protein n=3 Tax=Miltonvirus TaxID=2841278 RepID=K7YXT6_9CAUD|nr:head-tail adaptor Ad2 [Serratia phage phiMAM1]YP_009841915.1 head-tail adaptor Ad2 [Serratia phage vB_SmaA_3M]AFX93515.1 neck protein [Serratia phage phiMAM1]ASZ78819.1 neck protein [Serratia phage 2050H1]AYP28305.1 putative neck protein [Serratia phage vB_SmaA_3M]